jgi:DNA-directed RNA polymerase subunit RPC12/RpoP
MAHSERTPHHCRTCGGILRAVYEDQDKEPCALVCEGCSRELTFTLSARATNDKVARAQKKILYDAAENVWHKLSVNCPRCKAPLYERRRPNAANPIEVKCQYCEHTVFKKPTKAHKAAP